MTQSTLIKNYFPVATLKQLGIERINNAWSTGLEWGGETNPEVKEIMSPVDGNLIAAVRMATPADYAHIIDTAQKAFVEWPVALRQISAGRPLLCLQ
jgi:aldehyde dehydrogenase (NAD+)